MISIKYYSRNHYIWLSLLFLFVISCMYGVTYDKKFTENQNILAFEIVSKIVLSHKQYCVFTYMCDM